MASIDQPTSHREELGVVVELADQQFAVVSVLVTIGAPILAYLSGIASLMFYVHVALGAFWFGLDFFFKFVLGPSLDAAPDEAAGAVNRRLIPKIVVVAEATLHRSHRIRHRPRIHAGLLGYSFDLAVGSSRHRGVDARKRLRAAPSRHDENGRGTR